MIGESLGSGGLPAFKEKQPDEKAAATHGGGNGENPESNRARASGAVRISLRYVAIGVHQIATEVGRHIGGIARHALRLQLVNARFELLVVRHEGPVARRI